ncbi:hypothetical protein SGRIM128S_03571 [Streptomyces griseomycini]
MCAVAARYRAVLDGDSLTLDTDAMVWQRTGEDWSDVRLTLSTARSARATEPPRLGEDRLTLEERSPAERRTVHVELREEEIADLGPAPVLGLPGVDDGGEVRVLHSPAPVSVPSDGRAHRVPLSSFTTPAHSEYACSPVLSPLVQEAVQGDPTADHGLEALAARVRVSPRHLTRMFRAELDTTPVKYVELIRFDMAKALLDAGHNATEAAALSGFPSYESLRRAFARHLGLSPIRYQQRFATTAPGSRTRTATG